MAACGPPPSPSVACGARELCARGLFRTPPTHSLVFLHATHALSLLASGPPKRGRPLHKHYTPEVCRTRLCTRRGRFCACALAPIARETPLLGACCAERQGGRGEAFCAHLCAPADVTPPLAPHINLRLRACEHFTWHEREIFATFFSAPQNLCAHTRPVLPVPLPPPCSFLFLLPHACGAVLPRAFVARRAFAHTRALLSSAGKLPPVKCTHAVAARGERARNARARGVEIELDAHTTRRSVCVCVGLGPLLFFSQRHVCFGVAVVLSPAVWPSLALLRLCKKRVY